MLENSYPIRTDLALESQERLQEDQADMRGIRVLEERRENGVIVSTVMIETENASVAMGRPKGTYITIEAPEMIEEDAGYHRDISLELAKIMRNLLPGKEIEKNLKKGLEVAALVVGLGNREVTPDALGPRVVDNLFITRHILNEFGKYAFQREDVGKVSGIVPGVMAQTGMECVEILKGVVKETKPDFLITVDALAARSIRRLGRTIQLTDTGITPGSGIGNHRNAQAIEFARQFGQGQLLLTHCGHPQALNGPMAADQQHGAHHNQGVVWLPKDFGHPGVAQHLAQHSHRIAQHRHDPSTGDAGKQPTSGYLQISNGGIAHCCVANGPNEQRRQSPKNGGGDDGDGVIFFPRAQQRVP